VKDQSRALANERDDFRKQLNEMKLRYEEKLKFLKEDLELRLKVEVHEIEERKNLHINELMRDHEQAFDNMKSYNNDITYDNLNLIKSQKEEIKNIREHMKKNKELITQVSLENKQLKAPLIHYWNKKIYILKN
jgi:hypothetical protein